MDNNQRALKPKIKKAIFSKGFSIIEVVVSLILLSIGIYAVGQGYKMGRVFLRQADNRSIAMSIVSRKIDEYLAKTYASLEAGSISETELIKDKPFVWKVDVEDKSEGADVPSANKQIIPYKLITVTCSYQDRNIAGVLEDKQICMANMVPYPIIHVETVSWPPPEIPFDEETAPVVTVLPTAIATIDFKYKTNVNLFIVYNITFRIIKTNDVNQILPSHTILTDCVLDGVLRPIQTRTPILMQPFISNAIAVINVNKNGPPATGGVHRLTIRWCKDIDAGRIILKQISVICEAVERN